MNAAPTVAAILNAALVAQETQPVEPAVAAWAAWFDVLREHVAAANGSHPLRLDDVLAA